MEVLTDLTPDLEAVCVRILSDGGDLSQVIPGFIERSGQINLTRAIAKTISLHQTLVAEAGTGTGKTFAYLIPSLISRRKTFISTATKILQDQLMYKDLPLLTKALNVPIRVVSLKGRSNYICRYRSALYALDRRFLSLDTIADILYVQDMMPRLKEGIRSELPKIHDKSSGWSYVTSTADNCLGGQCTYYNDCFLVKARKRAMEADVVVINHHLFFADARLKEEGFGELLSNAEVIVFDEAHQIQDIATHFQGEQLSTRQLFELIDDCIKEWPPLDLANQPLNELRQQLDESVKQLIGLFPEEGGKFSWDFLERQAIFQDVWQEIIAVIQTLTVCFEIDVDEQLPGFLACIVRTRALYDLLISFEHLNNHFVQWVECFKHSLVLHRTPIDISASFTQILNRAPCSYIFTSATLSFNQSFISFTKPLGLESATTLIVESPFNFEQSALLYLPRNLPDPHHINYYNAFLEKALPIIHALKGRTFILFTSHKALQWVASRLQAQLPYPLLVQGEESKPILLERFRMAGNAVLLGTAAFWEGVDVKGEALSCVMIDKLPFLSPEDPVVKGKVAHLMAQGISGFESLSLPHAALCLKQGIGRLLRDVHDKGVVVIADPRLTARDYGMQLFKSLPPLLKTRDLGRVLSFINEHLAN